MQHSSRGSSKSARARSDASRALGGGLALALALTIGSAGLPAFSSPAHARIAGRILQTGTGSGVKNAVVKVALRPDAKVYESARTDAKGAYSLAGLPSGTYDVAVESSGGLYVSPAPVSLEAGEKRDLSLAIRADKPSGDTKLQEPAPGEPAPPPPPPPAEPTTPPPEPPKEEPKAAETKPAKKKVPFWRTPWGGAIIVVGTAAVVGAAAHSSDSSEPATASPSED